MGSAPTKRAYLKWENNLGGSDFLQLSDSTRGVLGWIDSDGIPQGNIVPPIATVPFLGTPSGPCQPTQTAVNSITGAFYSCSNGAWALVASTVGSLVSPVVSPNPLAFDTNINFKGPNPYTDVTRYGVRAVNQAVAPAVPGITVTINSTSTSATISAASTFQNGDGVVIFGAGPAHSMTTPVGLAVTPSVAAAGTGTGLVVNGPSGGATAYNYQIVARDKMGGLTAAGSVASTSVGVAALGAQNVAVFGFTRSGSTVTATTSAPHGLSVGSMVYVFCTTSSDNLNFGGWYVVSAVADTSHFSYVTAMDAAAGALTTSGAGGTANWFNCNHLSWTAVTGAFEYYIYGRTGGSLTLLGVSRPQNPNLQTPVIDTTWDDFGSPMMDGILLPYFVPNTPPNTATSDSLVTKIVSGAGTTALTLANAASTSVSSATILFDNAPNILTAANVVGSDGLLYFPAGSSYVVNSYLVLPVNLSISQAGTIWLNDTIEAGSATRWYGNLGPQGAGVPQFGWVSGNTVVVNRANPGIYGIGGGHFEGIQFAIQGNAGLAQVTDSYTQSNWSYVNYADAGSGYTSIALIMRTQGAVGFSDMSHVGFLMGPGQVNGISATPAMLFDNSMDFSYMSLNRRGFFMTPNPSGYNIQFRGNNRIQGGITPFFTMYNTGGAIGGAIYFNEVELDTMAHALLANLASPAGANLGGVTIRGGAGAAPALGFGYITGKPFGFIDRLNSGQNTSVLSTITVLTFTNLGTPANGAFAYCPDCTIANPCTGGGTGAFAKRLNGVWVCN